MKQVEIYSSRVVVGSAFMSMAFMNADSEEVAPIPPISPVPPIPPSHMGNNQSVGTEAPLSRLSRGILSGAGKLI